MKKILPPEHVKIQPEEFKPDQKGDFPIEGFSLIRLQHGSQLPQSVARALRVIHVRDFTLRTLMPDIGQKFADLGTARDFTNDPLHQRYAYLLLADEQVVEQNHLETNAAALGWFRPLIEPGNDPDTAHYDDYDLITSLQEHGYEPAKFVTGAIEVFDGYRPLLHATDVINAGVMDYTHHGGEDYEGVCVRVGTMRAVRMVEHSGFMRLTSEDGGGGIFLRQFTQPPESMV